MSRTTPGRSRRPWIVAITVLAALALIGCGGGADGSVTVPPTDTHVHGATETPATTASPPGTSEAGHDYRGVIVEPGITKPDFTLTDTTGQPFDFRARTEGKVALVYFGYTYCPDACPTQMADVAVAMRGLPPEIVERVQVVFVTTDPERDSPERLRRWLDIFDTRFAGLYGEEDALASIQRSFGLVPAERQDLGNDQYAMSHAAVVIAFTTDNIAHLLYPLGVSQDDWAHDIEKLVNEGWTTS